MTKFTVLLGCNYPPDDTRAEPGDVIDVSDQKVAAALLRAGAVEPHKAHETAPTTETTTETPQQAETGEEG